MPTHSSGQSRRPRRPKPATPPKKPYPDFPMYAHPTGYWAAKVNRRLLYFGRWGRIVGGVMTAVPYEAGWRDALATYKDRINDAKAGRVAGVVVSIVPEPEGVTVGDLRDKFLTAKSDALDCGEIGWRMYREYKASIEFLVEEFGERTLIERLTPDDFSKLRAKLAKRYGPVRLSKEVQMVRMTSFVRTATCC